MQQLNENVIDQYITVNNCGQQLLDKRDYDTVRENGRIDFGMQFIAEGRCRYEDNGVVRSIEAGSLILHFPDIRQHYMFKKEDKTLLMWSHFSGKACRMLEPLRSPETVAVKLSDPQSFREILQKMIDVYNLREAQYQTVCEGYMVVLIAMILKSADINSPDTKKHHEGIERVIGHMTSNAGQPIDLELYAKMCYVSRSRFLHIFKDYTGVSPYHYQLKTRIDRATEMLTFTSLSITEISEELGFKDHSYFCRIFKKFTGHTPGYYRK